MKRQVSATKRQQQMMKSNQMKSLVCLLLVIVCLIGVDGQFFTKSSKSIPRMGRRSLPDGSGGPMSLYRRHLIDTLIDQYGPSLLDALETKEVATERNSGGEVAMQNDQPFDFIGLPLVSNHLSSSSQPEGYSMISRDERSSLQPPQANYQALLMRAMGANRYIQQQLAPGQAQMSLDSLFGSGKERTNSAGGVLRNQDKSGGQEQKFQSD